MKALLLAGGLGTRLRPLTETRPKHLLPIANRPHIEHVFDLLVRHGITEVVLLSSYLAAAFEGVTAHAKARGFEVHTTREPEPMGTAGALKFAERLVGDGSFFVFNGDVLSDVDLSAVLEFHEARRAAATIVLTPVDDPSAYGVVPTDDGGRVLRFVEKPRPGEAPTNLINAGVYVLEPSVLERVPGGRPSSLEREVFPGMVEDGAPLYAWPTDSYWIDIGTPASYLQANLDALSGRYATTVTSSADGVIAAEGATIDDGARVSSACLGAGAQVSHGATVERSVLLPKAVVRPGAMVTRSIVGEGALVESGARVVDEVVADGGVVHKEVG